LNRAEFQVGRRYENVKGLYEVLAIDGDSMRIRRDHGEEIDTTATMQRRILERMQLERGLLSARSGGARERAPSAYGSQFVGLRESDFSRDVTGTTWRRRESLGGSVTARLRPSRGIIESWAVYRTSMVQWAYVDHRDPEKYYLQAKLFVQLDNECLRHGLYIERSNRDEDSKHDWNRFLAWIGDDNNQSSLGETARSAGMSIYDMKAEGPSSWLLVPDGDEWRLVDGSREEDVGSLARFLGGLTPEAWVDLYISKDLEKNQAIARGSSIAEDIARTFEKLMPAYDACCGYAG